jgi:hypothetical protein
MADPMQSLHHSGLPAHPVLRTQSAPSTHSQEALWLVGLGQVKGVETFLCFLITH